MPSILAEKLHEIVSPIVERCNAFLVDIVVRGERSSKVVELYVDSDKGISLEECSLISRELSTSLDETNLIQGRYRLDVSSPGLNRPLKLLRQYQKNIGRLCKVTWMNNGVKIVQEGILEETRQHTILISKSGGKYEIQFNDIVETYIIPQMKHF
ncbi:MAG: ribosome maturation factor RimP [Bacteroidota bacterium]|nr:ribosome maturation factor RimP [Bacteroidota bacterium]